MQLPGQLLCGVLTTCSDAQCCSEWHFLLVRYVRCVKNVKEEKNRANASDERDRALRLLHDVEVLHYVQLAAEKNKRGKAFKSQIDFVFANVVSAYSRQKQAKQQLLRSATKFRLWCGGSLRIGIPSVLMPCG